MDLENGDYSIVWKTEDFIGIWRNYEIDHVMQKSNLVQKSNNSSAHLKHEGNLVKVLRGILPQILDEFSICVQTHTETLWFALCSLWFAQRKCFLWVKVWSFQRLLVAQALSAYFLFYWLYGQDLLRANTADGVFTYFVVKGQMIIMLCDISLSGDMRVSACEALWDASLKSADIS